MLLKGLTEDQEKGIIHICNSTFPEIKNEIKKIKDKLGITITIDKSDNIFKIFDHGRNQVLKNEHIKSQYENMPALINSLNIVPWLEQNLSEEWKFVNSFDYYKFITDEIRSRVKHLDIDSYSNLLEIDNYEAYWHQYSIKQVDKTILRASTNISKTIDKLIVDLQKEYGGDEKKTYIINQALKKYILNKDVNSLHSYLVDEDFFDIRKNEKIKLQKEAELRNKEINKKLLNDCIYKEKIKENNLIEMKISGTIENTDFEFQLNKIRNTVEDYKNKIVDLN